MDFYNQVQPLNCIGKDHVGCKQVWSLVREPTFNFPDIRETSPEEDIEAVHQVNYTRAKFK